MWAEYTTTPQSVVISTTFTKLTQLLPSDRLIMSREKYVGETTPRCEFFHTTPFFYKDEQFSFENELRIVRPVLTGEQVMVNNDKDFGRLVAVDLTRLIDRIAAKNMPEPVLDKMRELAGRYCGGAQILRSVVEPGILCV
jgi:hypothetical protein